MSQYRYVKDACAQPFHNAAAQYSCSAARFTGQWSGPPEAHELEVNSAGTMPPPVSRYPGQTVGPAAAPPAGSEEGTAAPPAARARWSSLPEADTSRDRQSRREEPASRPECRYTAVRAGGGVKNGDLGAAGRPPHMTGHCRMRNGLMRIVILRVI